MRLSCAFHYAKVEFLSEPIIDIDPEEKDIIKLELGKNGLVELEPTIDTVKLQVYYQDALNNLCVVSPDAAHSHNYLKKFGSLPQKVGMFSLKYVMYRYRFRKAIKQRNTHVDRLESHSD